MPVQESPNILQAGLLHSSLPPRSDNVCAHLPRGRIKTWIDLERLEAS